MILNTLNTESGLTLFFCFLPFFIHFPFILLSFQMYLFCLPSHGLPFSREKRPRVALCKSPHMHMAHRGIYTELYAKARRELNLGHHILLMAAKELANSLLRMRRQTRSE